MLLAAAAQAEVPSESSIAGKAERDEIERVARNDPAMAAAMRKARQTLPDFLALAQDPPPGMEGFGVKIAIQGECGAEYFWIHPFTHMRGRFSGRINNMSRTVPHVNLGDRITFTEDEIVDWVYLDDGAMQGNYTARAMLKKAPPEEREAFRKRYGLDPDF
jgi:uncharacterized protein YegJ (DUF2314 family)